MAQKDLTILSTAVDRVNQTLTVQGAGFGAQSPQVWCETYQMTVISATDTQLVVFLPGGVPDGTHLLTVSRGNGEKDRTFHMPSEPRSGTCRSRVRAEGDLPDRWARGRHRCDRPSGDVGAAGATGPKGDTGRQDRLVLPGQGDTGAAGATGATGYRACGTRRARWACGTSGPAGPTGPAGPQGEVGPAGPTGRGRPCWTCRTEGGRGHRGTAG